MTSEVEERPRLFTGGYGWHRRQWVKETIKNDHNVVYASVFLLINQIAGLI